MASGYKEIKIPLITCEVDVDETPKAGSGNTEKNPFKDVSVSIMRQKTVDDPNDVLCYDETTKECNLPQASCSFHQAEQQNLQLTEEPASKMLKVDTPSYHNESSYDRDSWK